jgi:hypothetical protein
MAPWLGAAMLLAAPLAARPAAAEEAVPLFIDNGPAPRPTPRPTVRPAPRQPVPLVKTVIQAPARPQPSAPVVRPVPTATPTVTLGGQHPGDGPMYVFVVPVVGGQPANAGPVSVQVRRQQGTQQVEVLVPTGQGQVATSPAVAPTNPPAVVPTSPPVPWTPSWPGSEGTGLLAARLDAAIVSEASASGGVDLDPGLVPGAVVDLAVPLAGAWGLDARLGYRAYTLADAQAPESQHHRDEFDARLGATYDLGGAWLEAGAWGRYMGVANNFPLPLDTPFVTAPSQLLLAPRLAVGTRWEPLPGLYLRGEAAALPYVLARGDATVEALGPLYGLGAGLVLGWRPWPWLALEAGVRADRLHGFASDYVHTEVGPSLGLGGRF